LLYCAKSGLQHSELLKLFDIIDLSRTDRKKIGVKYENSYWDDFTITLDETKNFLIANIEKWSAKSNTVGTIAKKYDYFNNSVISTIQNFSLNTNFQSKKIVYRVVHNDIQRLYITRIEGLGINSFVSCGF